MGVPAGSATTFSCIAHVSLPTGTGGLQNTKYKIEKNKKQKTKNKKPCFVAYAGWVDLQNHFFPFFRSFINANDRKKKNAYDSPKQIALTKLRWPVIKSQYVTDKSTFQPWTTNSRFATALMRLATSMTKSSMLTGSSGTQILMNVQNFPPNFVELVLNLQIKCQKINGFILKVFQRRRNR